MNKVKTSIHYQLAHVKLRAEVFEKWKEFTVKIKEGPQNFNKYLVALWNEVKEILKDNEQLDVMDINREVTEKDFTASFLKDKDIFYIIMPKVNGYAEAQSIFICFGKEKIRYFTVELCKNKMQGIDYWVLGEWLINNNQYIHNNYGKVDPRYIEEKLMEILK